jgi:hypothetical protein
VRSKGWRYEYEEDGRAGPMPERIEAILANTETTFPVVRVWPSPEWLAIFRPWTADEIKFDVDLCELQGQQRLDELCGFLRTIGQRLREVVTMYPEGSGPADLQYLPEADRVVNIVPPHRRHPPG